jgi:aminoglycoside phosphotransferase (APT) family kinase protein
MRRLVTPMLAAVAELSLIGRGRTAEVFAWGDRQVVKLFYPELPMAAIERETRAAAAVARSDVPAPAFGGKVEVEGRTGLVFERVSGPSMLSLLSRQPWRVVGLARQLADLHAQIHAVQVTDLQSLREYVHTRIERASGISDVMRATAFERLGGLADGDRLCHGDFHPDNVVVTRSGLVVLDWMNATRGAPAADVARTMLLLQHASPLEDSSLALKVFTSVFRRLFAAAYWRAYARRTRLNQSDVDAWQVPLFTARLSENLPNGEREHMLGLLQRRQIV